MDGCSIEDFEKDLQGSLYKIWNRMSSGSCFPPPVRAVEIPKAHGGGIRIQVDVARAYSQRRQVADAVSALLRACVLSPEMVRALPIVKQLAADLLTMSQPPSEELRALAGELGVGL